MPLLLQSSLFQGLQTIVEYADLLGYYAVGLLLIARCMNIRRASVGDLEKLREEIAKLDKDLQRQNEIVEELCRKVC